MALASLSLDLPMMEKLDLSMLGIMKLTLNCSKLVYANLRGSYKLTSAVSNGEIEIFGTPTILRHDCSCRSKTHAKPLVCCNAPK